MTMNEQIGNALQKAGNAGLASFEVAAQLGATKKDVNKALRTLELAGMVYDSGQRRVAPSGRRVPVWFAASDADFSGPVETIKVAKAPPRRRKTKRSLRESRELRKRLLKCARQVAETKPFFTADDVREAFEGQEDAAGFGRVDARITGPVMLQAAKERWCVKTSQATASERRRNGLSSVYKSLLCEPKLRELPAFISRATYEPLLTVVALFIDHIEGDLPEIELAARMREVPAETLALLPASNLKDQALDSV